MKTLLKNTSFVYTSALALLFCGAVHFELPELGACFFMFMLFTVNLKR